MSEGPLFILAGNGPYMNRGCEAIVRGTVNILRQQYHNPKFVCISHFTSKDEYENQEKNETDSSITHLSSRHLSKRDAISTFYRPDSWSYIYRSLFNNRKLGYSTYSEVLPYLSEAKAVLSVGGDNYSLDYGKPNLFTSLDDLVFEKNRPLAIWGASVGPFDKLPSYEKYMSRHLKRINGIFARESATIDYLKGIGVYENVYHVADPAFLMNPIKPEGIESSLPLDEEMIGINLSPLMAKYITGGDLETWAKMAASILDDVIVDTELPICLIPHVTMATSNDYTFMHRALRMKRKSNRKIITIPPNYNAAETKWIISKMAFFAGARMHSTIASISSGVPTLSLSYSIKSKGINKDFFGHTDYCLDGTALNPESISSKIRSLLDGAAQIRRDMNKRLDDIGREALLSGRILRDLLMDVRHDSF